MGCGFIFPNRLVYDGDGFSKLLFAGLYCAGAFWMQPMATFGVLLTMGHLFFTAVAAIINLAISITALSMPLPHLERVCEK